MLWRGGGRNILKFCCQKFCTFTEIFVTVCSNMGHLPRGLSDFVLRLFLPVWVFVVTVWLWILDYAFMMASSFFWKSFLALARFQLFVLAVLLSSHVKCITILHTPSYMQGDPTVMPGQQRDNKPVSDVSRDRISYSRDQLMAINPSRLTKDLTTRLRSLEIGTSRVDTDVLIEVGIVAIFLLCLILLHVLI